MFSDDVFAAIRSAWEADQDHPRRNRLKLPIPDEALLRAVLESAFVASLRREEGRELRFALCVVPLDKGDQATWLHGPSTEVIPFASSEPLNAETICKLASACDPSSGALLVDPDLDATSNYRVWGMIYYGSPLRALTETSTHIDGLSCQRPDVPTVTATSPGSLLLSRGFSQIGRFVLGEFHPAQPTPLVHRALGQYIERLLQPEEGRDGLRYYHWYLLALERLLDEIGSRGHGGTIMLSRDYGDMEDLFVRYGFQHDLQIPHTLQLLVEWESQKRSVSSLVEAKAVLRRRLDFLAQLACADGALLLGKAMAPIAFGVTLRAKSWEGEVTAGPAPILGQNQALDLARLGTRHNSAAAYAAAHPGTIAFVVSHDGPIRAFVRDSEGPLLYWADCTLSMFV